MKKKNGMVTRFVSVLIICLTLTAFVAAAAGAGTSGDPLVTLSYLNNTYYNTIMKDVDGKVSERNTAMESKIKDLVKNSSTGGEAGTFTVVTMSRNQVLTGDIGCEVMLRVGTASCVSASAPGLIDTTGGGSINGGTALTKNHLYMMTIEDRGVKATADTVKLLVRGSYTIG